MAGPLLSTSCSDCPPAAAALRRQVEAYLAAERTATAAFRAAGPVEPSTQDGQPPARGAYPLAWPAWAAGGTEPADLPPAVRPGTVGQHLALLASTPAAGQDGVDDVRRVVAAVQDCPMPVTPGHLTVVFPAGTAAELALLRTLLGTAELPESWAVGGRHVAPVLGYCRAALSLLDRRAPDLGAGFAGLVSAIVVAARRGTGAASSSAAIGAIHLCPRASWPVPKYVELLVHEFVHQALFLDECVHGMFTGDTSELASRDAVVLSAVRKVPRGYDKSFHAAYVAYVQRRLYSRLSLDDPKPPGPLDHTLGELGERRQWLTPHGRLRLAELVEFDRRFPPTPPGARRRGEP
jgi:hypothetical protein